MVPFIKKNAFWILAGIAILFLVVIVINDSIGDKVKEGEIKIENLEEEREDIYEEIEKKEEATEKTSKKLEKSKAVIVKKKKEHAGLSEEQLEMAAKDSAYFHSLSMRDKARILSRKVYSN